MEDNKNDFINAIKLAEKTKFKDISLQNISLEERTKEIYNLFG
mgnify:FL=1